MFCFNFDKDGISICITQINICLNFSSKILEPASGIRKYYIVFNSEKFHELHLFDEPHLFNWCFWEDDATSLLFHTALRWAPELAHGVSQLITCQSTPKSPRRRSGPLHAAPQPSPSPTEAWPHPERCHPLPVCQPHRLPEGQCQ